MWNTLVEYLQYPFVRRILVAGVLVAFCASMLGVTLVLKRFSYIGDGLSHVAFAAMAIAMVLRMTNNTLIILPITVVAAILMLKTGQNAKINGDAVIAMLSVGSLACQRSNGKHRNHGISVDLRILSSLQHQDCCHNRDRQYYKCIVRHPQHHRDCHRSKCHMGQSVSNIRKAF